LIRRLEFTFKAIEFSARIVQCHSMPSVENADKPNSGPGSNYSPAGGRDRCDRKSTLIPKVGEENMTRVRPARGRRRRLMVSEKRGCAQHIRVQPTQCLREGQRGDEQSRSRSSSEHSHWAEAMRSGNQAMPEHDFSIGHKTAPTGD
jgi:hypothetical protein